MKPEAKKPLATVYVAACGKFVGEAQQDGDTLKLAAEHASTLRAGDEIDVGTPLKVRVVAKVDGDKITLAEAP